MAAVKIMFCARIPNLKFTRNFRYLHFLNRKMEQQPCEVSSESVHSITEGTARIRTTGKVFYNPVQEFNRDLRLELRTFPQNGLMFSCQ